MNNNPKYRQEWILDNLKISPTIAYLELFTSYSLKFTKTVRTFAKDWNVASKRLKDYQSDINKAKLEQSIASEKQAVKQGLKTKFQRLMILQNQIEVCLEQLTSKQCDDVYFIEGMPADYKRNMNQRELNDTRKTLNILQIEISKIEGDYAAVKTIDLSETKNLIIKINRNEDI